MNKILFIISVFIFISLGLYAQKKACTITLKGKVNDLHDGTPVVFAFIHLDSTNYETYTDEKGGYQFEGLCPGEYVVCMEMFGFENVQQKVMLTEDTLINIYPEVHAEILEGLELEGNHYESHPGEIVEQLSGEKLEHLRGMEVGESLKEVSGANALQTGAQVYKPMIHGLYGNRVRVVNNGVNQEDQQWGQEHASAVDPFLASKIKVVKGASAVQYGNEAMAGVVLIEPADLPTEGEIHGDVFLVGKSNGKQGIGSFLLEGGVKKWKGFGWRANATYKKAGDTHAPNYNLSNTGAEQLNYSLAAGYAGEKVGVEGFFSSYDASIGILRAAHIGNTSDLEAALEAEEPWYVEPFTYKIAAPRQDVLHRLWKAKGYYYLNDAVKFNLQYAGQFNNRKEYDVRRGGRSDKPSIDMDLTNHTVNFSADHSLSPKLNGRAGIDYLYETNINIEGTGVRPLIPNYEKTGYGVYAIEHWHTKSVDWSLGLRYDFQHMSAYRFDKDDVLQEYNFEFNTLAASLGLDLITKSSWSLSSNVALTMRPPNVNELLSEGLHHGAGAIEEGDVNLDKEKGYKWTTQVGYDFSENTKIHVTGYQHYIQDYIYLNPSDTRLTIRGAFPVFSYEQTDVVLLGADVDFNTTLLDHLLYDFKFSFIRAQDISNGVALIYMPADRFQNRVTYQVKKNDNTLAVSFGLTSVGRQHRAPEGVDFAPAPGAYHLLNGAVSYRLKKHLFVELACENIMNIAYREYLNRLRYYADELGRNFILRTHINF